MNHPDLSLLPWGAIYDMAVLMTWATATGKHPRDGWMHYSEAEHIRHMTDHLAAYAAGDTSEDHLVHAMTRAAMAVAVRKRRRGQRSVREFREHLQVKSAHAGPHPWLDEEDFYSEQRAADD